jgi:hypothetical protein
LNDIKPQFDKIEMDDVAECEAAAQIYQWENHKNSQIATIYLIASYILRDEKDEKSINKRKEMQRQSLSFFIKAVEEKEDGGKDIGQWAYIVGELYRRTGNFEKSMEWFQIAEKTPGNTAKLKELIQEQKMMTEKKDDDNNI